MAKQPVETRTIVAAVRREPGGSEGRQLVSWLPASGDTLKHFEADEERLIRALGPRGMIGVEIREIDVVLSDLGDEEYLQTRLVLSE